MSSEPSASSSSATEGGAKLQVNVKTPSGKISVDLESFDMSVADFKAKLAELNPDTPADQQRLIYSGRVLADQEPLTKYGLKTGHTIHLVKGAKPAAPPAGASAAAQGVPSNFAAGQQFTGNPLAPLLNAENAGAFAGFNPFAGHNTNNPDLFQNMMNDPAVQANINNLLRDPAIIDQVIASNPELQAMGPQVRTLMQSEQFRSFLSNPQAMQQMRSMAQMMGMPGGAGGMGGFGGFGGGGGGGGGDAAPRTESGGTPSTLYNPWAPSPASAPSTTGATTGGAAGQQGAFNPFAAFGGGGGGTGGQGAGGMPDFAQMMANMQALQGMGGFGAAGGGGSPATQSQGPQQSPEERYATQLEQLAGMGFHDASKNVRALLASGGHVEGAVEWLFSNP